MCCVPLQCSGLELRSPHPRQCLESSGMSRCVTPLHGMISELCWALCFGEFSITLLILDCEFVSPTGIRYTLPATSHENGGGCGSDWSLRKLFQNHVFLPVLQASIWAHMGPLLTFGWYSQQTNSPGTPKPSRSSAGYSQA